MAEGVEVMAGVTKEAVVKAVDEDVMEAMREAYVAVGRGGGKWCTGWLRR